MLFGNQLLTSSMGLGRMVGQSAGRELWVQDGRGWFLISNNSSSPMS